MELNASNFNGLAILAALVAGQVISTVWFVVLFGEPWAREYGAESKQAHAKAVPPYTYAVQALCTLILVLSISALQAWLGVDSALEAVTLALFVTIGLAISTGLPGQAFLRRWRVAAIALGSQAAMILGISLVLVLWR